MNIGLYDMDSHNFPNLALMKISAYHKSKGDNVQMLNHLMYYDKVYVSKVFSDEYTKNDITCINADNIEYGGTGFAISIQDGKEYYDKNKDIPLKDEIEHMYPDYNLYTEYKDNAYGFLTRGCCNNCSFCIVSKKEGLCSKKVANLSEFWNGQKNIVLLDPNLLACKDRMDLLTQLKESKAYVDFTQGLDARFVDDDIAKILNEIKVKTVHFAFDFMKNEKQIVKGLTTFKKYTKYDIRKTIVYMLTNYDTTIEEDLYRLRKIKELGLTPDVRIYRKQVASQLLHDMQRWCNNRYIYRTVDFMDYIPRKDGKTIKELYF